MTQRAEYEACKPERVDANEGGLWVHVSITYDPLLVLLPIKIAIEASYVGLRLTPGFLTRQESATRFCLSGLRCR